MTTLRQFATRPIVGIKALQERVCRRSLLFEQRRVEWIDHPDVSEIPKARYRSRNCKREMAQPRAVLVPLHRSKMLGNIPSKCGRLCLFFVFASSFCRCKSLELTSRAPFIPDTNKRNAK